MTETDDTSAGFVLARGAKIAFVLGHSPSTAPLQSPLKVEALVKTTKKEEWKGWIGRLSRQKILGTPPHDARG